MSMAHDAKGGRTLSGTGALQKSCGMVLILRKLKNAPKSYRLCCDHDAHTGSKVAINKSTMEANYSVFASRYDEVPDFPWL